MLRAKKLFNFGMLLFAFFPLIPNKFKGLPVIILFLLAVVLFIAKQEFKFDFKKVILFSSLYLLYLFSLLYTTNLQDIDKTLSTRLSLLVFPLIFALVNITITKRQLLIFLQTYFIATIVYCCLIVFYFYQEGFLTSDVDVRLYYSHLTYEMWYVNQHPIYASIFIGIAILFGIKLVYTFQNVKFKLGFGLGLILLILMLLFLSRKGVILAVGLTVISYVIYQLKGKTKKKYVIGGLIAIVVVLIGTPITQKRFKEIFNPHSYSNVEKTNSTSIRFQIYKCALKKIKEKPFVGFGVGDVKDELNTCYALHAPLLLEENYNSHNQYLSIWLSNGIVGLIIFLFFLFINFKMAILRKKIVFLLLLIFYAIVMLFENILERQSGVILFSLFINFFAFIDVDKDINKR